MIVNESVELAEMYKAELLKIKDTKESDEETTSKRVFVSLTKPPINLTTVNQKNIYFL